MTSRLIAFFALVLSSTLALCWRPLGAISETHLVNTQILFYAFASAALLSVPFLFKQANAWRPHAPLLIIFAIVSSAANILLQYSLIEGQSLVVISVFCITLSCLLLFFKTELDMTLNFVVTLLVMLSAIMVLFFLSDGLKHHWTEWAAALVAFLYFGLLRLDRFSGVLPLGSKLSASLIASTWLIGMITIFSERLSSYIQDNAVGFSVMYGLLCVMPIVGSVLYVLSKKHSHYILLWLPLLLAVSVLDFYLNPSLLESVASYVF